MTSAPCLLKIDEVRIKVARNSAKWILSSDPHLQDRRPTRQRKTLACLQVLDDLVV